MRKVDLTKKVMEKVTRFESRRIKFWLFKSILALIGLLGSILFLSWVFQKELFERKVLDLFYLLNEDREIILEFWQDTLVTIWEEIPHVIFFLLGLTFITFIIVIIVVRKRLPVIRKKLSHLAKYSRNY